MEMTTPELNAGVRKVATSEPDMNSSNMGWRLQMTTSEPDMNGSNIGWRLQMTTSEPNIS